MKTFLRTSIFNFLLVLSAMASTQALLPKDFDKNQVPTVGQVDIQRYVGKWYAMYSLPQFFTRNCTLQTADYEVLSENSISVLNTCFKPHGKTQTIKGKAVVENKQTNAELIVTFDSFFTKLFRVKGDYNIIALDENYEFVMVGSNDRKSLWIMARRPEVPRHIQAEYFAYAQKLGYDISKLIPSRL